LLEVILEPFSFISGCVAGSAGVGLLYLGFMIVHPWIRMKLCGGKGTLLYLVAMRFRGTPVAMIVDAYVSLLQSCAIISLREVEAHYVANQSRIISSTDLMDSMSEEPIKTHVAVWLMSEDAQWLADHLSAQAEQLSGNHTSEEETQERDEIQHVPEASQIEADRCDRIAQRATAAACKAQKVSQRR
jgi:hypothetical protein